jgi:hypothetical protein
LQFYGGGSRTSELYSDFKSSGAEKLFCLVWPNSSGPKAEAAASGLSESGSSVDVLYGQQTGRNVGVSDSVLILFSTDRRRSVVVGSFFILAAFAIVKVFAASLPFGGFDLV